MALFHNIRDAWLLLEDGTIYTGSSFGAAGTTIGEVVFTTSMTGYQETLTDPSYYGQIVTQTFPLIGNYGVNDEDSEAPNPALKGYIVREWCENPSNFRCKENLDTFLKEHNVIGLYDIDTRALTRKLRESGTMNGMITTQDPTGNVPELLEQIHAYRIVDAVKNVSVTAPEFFEAESEPKYHVALLDYGYKHNIRRGLVKRGCSVTVVPYNTTAQEIAAMGVDGIMLSNGPGDPAQNVEAIANLKEMMQLKIPIFGICLGHQLLALANGAKREKLHYGHRGGNQPVTDIDHGRTLVTTQNHGYAIINESIDPSVGRVSHTNANDRTCEGVKYLKAPAFTVQFHPEAYGGPRDTAYLFDEFLDMMKKYREEK